MGEYFKPLGRKIGLVTLVVACVFVGAWVRSLSRFDTLDTKYFPSVAVRSHLGELYLYSGTARATPTSPPIGWWSGPASKWMYQEFEGTWGALGFGWKREQNGVVIGFPYWAIVFPLTYLSIRLLVTRTPVKKPVPALDQET